MVHLSRAVTVSAERTQCAMDAPGARTALVAGNRAVVEIRDATMMRKVRAFLVEDPHMYEFFFRAQESVEVFVDDEDEPDVIYVPDLRRAGSVRCQSRHRSAGWGSR